VSATSPDARQPFDHFDVATAAAVVLAHRTGVERHDVAVVLGSGWGRCADALGTGPSVPVAELPGFPAPSALGHGAEIRSIDVAGLRVLVFLGRIHLYEGHDPAVVAHGVRVAAAAGCHAVVLTNGAGSLQRDWPIGQPVLISDHINLTGRSPLTGPNPPAPFGSRFVDLTDLYCVRLRAVARTVDPGLPEGVYMGFHGPHFETPAEIRMAGIVGADLVGMSTVLEAIAARHVGLDVLGISLATNLAAGISPVPLDASDVIAAGDAAAGRLGVLLRGILEALAA
jgi:purine-nucleoside phosphorylase